MMCMLVLVGSIVCMFFISVLVWVVEGMIVKLVGF